MAAYRALAEVRYLIRKFLRFSEEQTRKIGLEPRQHQMLLAVKGLPAGMRPTIGVLAERLQIAPHSTVELVNRLVKARLVERRRDAKASDRREVLVKLSKKGEEVLRKLSLAHRAELLAEGQELVESLEKVLYSGSGKKRKLRNTKRG